MDGITIENNIITKCDLINIDFLDLSSLTDVISINKEVFIRKSITTLILPPNIISLGDNAFDSNRIEELIIPASVSAIGIDCFKNNFLTKVSFENENIVGSGMVLNDGCFRNNYINQLIYGNRRLVINKNAFLNNKLVNLDINSNIVYIGEKAFANNSLQTLKFQNVLNIAFFAFSNNNLNYVEASSLFFDTYPLSSAIWFNNPFLRFSIENFGDYTVEILVDSTLKLKAYNGTANNIIINSKISNREVSIIGESLFENKNIKSIVLPNNIKVIEKRAFYGNDINTLLIPDRVINIGEEAFANSNIATLTLNKNIGMLGIRAFANNKINKIVIYPFLADKYPFPTLTDTDSPFYRMNGDTMKINRVLIGEEFKISDYIHYTLRGTIVGGFLKILYRFFGLFDIVDNIKLGVLPYICPPIRFSITVMLNDLFDPIQRGIEVSDNVILDPDTGIPIRWQVDIILKNPQGGTYYPLDKDFIGRFIKKRLNLGVNVVPLEIKYLYAIYSSLNGTDTTVMIDNDGSNYVIAIIVANN